METIAKVFKSGNSQAIHIPKQFRFNCDKVKIISKNGFFIIKPIESKVRKNWNKAFQEMRKNGDDKLLMDDVS